MKKIFLFVSLILFSACTSLTSNVNNHSLIDSSLANFSDEVLFNRFNDSNIIKFDYEKTIYYYDELYGNDPQNKLLKTLKVEYATREFLVEYLKNFIGVEGTANELKSLIYQKFFSVAEVPSNTSNLLYQLIALVGGNYVELNFGEDILIFVKIDDNDLRAYVKRNNHIVDPIFEDIRVTLNTVKNVEFYNVFIGIVGAFDTSSLNKLSMDERNLMGNVIGVYIAEYFRFKHTPKNTYQRDMVSGVLLNYYLVNSDSKKEILNYLATNGWNERSNERKKMEEQITAYVRAKHEVLYNGLSKIIGADPDNLFYDIAVYLENPQADESFMTMHEFIDILASEASEIEEYINSLAT